MAPETTVEKLGRLSREAQRLHGTRYYEGKHRDIDLALGEWEREREHQPSLG